MAQNLNDLANRLDKYADALPVAVSNLAVDVALTVLKNLVYITPVDTSEALSNWVITLGSPSSNAIPPHFLGLFGSTQGISATEAMARGNAVLKNKKPGQTIFITNNAGHIRKLNEGSSKQQPAGFVQRSAMIGRKMKKTLKLKV